VVKGTPLYTADEKLTRKLREPYSRYVRGLREI